MNLAAALLALRKRTGVGALSPSISDPLCQISEIVQTNPYTAEGRTIARFITAIGNVTSEEFSEADLYMLSSCSTAVIVALADDQIAGRYQPYEWKATLLGIELSRRLFDN